MTNKTLTNGQIFGDIISKDLIKEEYLKLGKPLGEPNPDILKKWSHQQIDAVIDGKISTLHSTDLISNKPINR